MDQILPCKGRNGEKLVAKIEELLSVAESRNSKYTAQADEAAYDVFKKAQEINIKLKVLLPEAQECADQ